MDRFPDDVHFRGRWRVYQQRVLDELEGYLDDEKLHVVAAPGSGKTTLGLEVVRRLDAATLILAPTITIRDQWVGRLVGHFLPESSERPDWVSSDLRRPGFVTVVTYQALHAATTGKRDGDEEALENGDVEQVDVAAVLREAGLRTLVVDEAHHLRTEWWRVLVELSRSMEGLRIVALTATPPYDVPQAEWKRYRDLCGPMDTEVPVPELVAHGDLCAHQDLVRLSAPSEEEGEQLSAFRSEVREFVADLRSDEAFRAALLSHPWMRDPREHHVSILGEAAVFTSMLVYVKAAGMRVPRSHLRVLHMGSGGLPNLTLPVLEVLLNHLLEHGEEEIPEHTAVLEAIRDRLKRVGAIERRKLRLTGTRELDRMLATSVTKLDSIVDVVRDEAGVMGEELRLVVLTDFVRREDMPRDAESVEPLKRLGVVPIFESIRRRNIGRLRAGILSGSLVVLPESAVQPLRDAAVASGIPADRIRATPYPADAGFAVIGIEGADRKAMVRLVTEMFIAGEVTALVGTAALLGEGWDAPVINSLVLASYVGSYMLSNQMRGRAIRTVAGDPE
ncbi:MAG: DEAD/DEAH box helicase family protein, partial [Planctomycetota bacterium]